MKKDTIKNEMIEEIEINEETKAEELTEETLENVDGGAVITGPVVGLLLARYIIRNCF